MCARAIDAVIFDLDNTLTDFMLAKENSIRAAVDAMIDSGLPLNQQEAVDSIFAIYKKIGIEHQRVFNVFLEKIIGKVDDRILAAGVVAYRRARGGSLVPYPHAHFVLNKLLKDGYKLAVVSDAPRFEAWQRLNYIGLQHTFDVVLTFDDTGHHKPDPKPFQMALDILNVSADRTVLIGDWIERDILGGQNAGLHTVYARYGDKYSQYADKVDDADTKPDFVVDDLLQLMSVIETLNAKGDSRPGAAS
ncbi:MAG: HAD-IA family hydrolase [bacterium]|nr:HAD-IA family hydrolase [bacterium]